MIPFGSRRNQVYPVLWEGCGAVEKHFQNLEDWEREQKIYQTLRLPHPELLETRPGVILTAFCRFPTLLEELESQEKSGFCAAPWEALCTWIAGCSKQLGMLPAEGNLRNYLWDARHGIVLGPDFEDFCPMRIADSAAALIAALLEDTPTGAFGKTAGGIGAFNTTWRA